MWEWGSEEGGKGKDIEWDVIVLEQVRFYISLGYIKKLVGYGISECLFLHNFICNQYIQGLFNKFVKTGCIMKKYLHRFQRLFLDQNKLLLIPFSMNFVKYT